MPQRKNRTSLEALAAPPADLAALADAVALHARLTGDRARLEARFAPLRERYRVLRRFEVDVDEAEAALLDGLEPAWGRFLEGLEAAGARLDASKAAFRERVRAALDALLREVAAQAEEFERLQPLAPPADAAGDDDSSSPAVAAADGSAANSKAAASADVGAQPAPSGQEQQQQQQQQQQQVYTVPQALQFVARWRDNVAAARGRVAELKPGLDLFGIPLPPCPELATMEGRLDALQALWALIEGWQSAFAAWKGTPFARVVVDALDADVARTLGALHALPKDCGAWPAAAWARARVEGFKRALPLIADLRHPAMRPRHWQQLREHVARE